jgi:hypothetical protein
MVASVAINGAMAWAFIITVLYCIGNLEDALSGIYVYPIIEILYASTGSKGGTTTLMTLIVFLGIIAMFSTLASVSRLTWAFARDKGLPFSDFFSKVCHSQKDQRPKTNILSGPPTFTHSAQLVNARHLHRHASQPDQPWFDDRLFRHSFAQHTSSIHLLLHSNPLLHHGQTSRRRYPVRPISPGKIWPSDQRLRARVRHLHFHILTIPTICASYGSNYELWRSSDGIRDYIRNCGLVLDWEEEVPGSC